MNSERNCDDEGVESNAEQNIEAQMESDDQSQRQPTLNDDQMETLDKFKELHLDHGQQIDEEGSVVQKDDSGHVSLRHPPLPFDDLRPQDRVTCCDLSKSPDLVLWGKYLLCQTISSAAKDVALEVVVTDPEGSSTLGLALYNYCYAENSGLALDVDGILPPGSFLVVKNPLCTSNGSGFLFIDSDNPEEVELISKKRMEKKFEGIKWSETKLNFWTEIDWTESDDVALEKCKRFGNLGFVEKRYSDALRFYDMALDYCGENREEISQIYANKASSLLALGCFHAALKCLKFALKVEPGNEKYIYRRTKALIGIQMYEEAVSFLEAKIDQFPSLSSSSEIQNLLDGVKLLASRKSLGPTQSQLLSIRMGTRAMDEFIPEFTSRSLKVSPIEGKGRGLIATREIAPGTLLICAKAFGYVPVAPNCHLPTKSDHEINSDFLNQAVLTKVANKLVFEPSLGQELYKLTAGAYLGHLDPREDSLKMRHVDMNRLAPILKINSFRVEHWREENVLHRGLWILPSYLNHSCSEANCLWDIFGDVMIVSSIAEIKKGEELTVSYFSPTVAYEERCGLSHYLEFTCDCKLCQLEAAEPESVKEERCKILQSLEELPCDAGPGTLRKMLQSVEKLVAFRKNNAPLNFPLLTPQIYSLATILLRRGRVEDRIAVLRRMFEVAGASVCWHFEGIGVGVMLMVAHAEKHDVKFTKMWMKIVKQLVFKLFGNLEFMRLVEAEAVELLQTEMGIDFFRDD